MMCEHHRRSYLSQVHWISTPIILKALLMLRFSSQTGLALIHKTCQRSKKNRIYCRYIWLLVVTRDSDRVEFVCRYTARTSQFSGIKTIIWLYLPELKQSKYQILFNANKNSKSLNSYTAFGCHVQKVNVISFALIFYNTLSCWSFTLQLCIL